MGRGAGDLGSEDVPGNRDGVSLWAARQGGAEGTRGRQMGVQKENPLGRLSCRPRYLTFPRRRGTARHLPNSRPRSPARSSASAPIARTKLPPSGAPAAPQRAPSRSRGVY